MAEDNEARIRAENRVEKMSQESLQYSPPRVSVQKPMKFADRSEAYTTKTGTAINSKHTREKCVTTRLENMDASIFTGSRARGGGQRGRAPVRSAGSHTHTHAHSRTPPPAHTRCCSRSAPVSRSQSPPPRGLRGADASLPTPCGSPQHCLRDCNGCSVFYPATAGKKAGPQSPKSYEELEKDLETLIGSTHALNSEYRILCDQFQEMSQQNRDLRVEVYETKSALEDAKTDNEKLKLLLASLDKTVKALQEGGSVHTAEVARVRNENDSLLSERLSLQEKLGVYQVENIALKTKLESVQNDFKKLEVQFAELSRKSAHEVETKASRIRFLERRLNETEESLAQLQLNYNRDIQNAMFQNRDLEAQMKTLRYRNQNLLKRIRGKTESANEANEAGKQMEAELDVLAKTVSDLRIELANSEDHRRELEEELSEARAGKLSLEATVMHHRDVLVDRYREMSKECEDLHQWRRRAQEAERRLAVYHRCMADPDGRISERAGLASSYLERFGGSLPHHSTQHATSSASLSPKKVHATSLSPDAHSPAGTRITRTRVRNIGFEIGEYEVNDTHDVDDTYPACVRRNEDCDCKSGEENDKGHRAGDDGRVDRDQTHDVYTTDDDKTSDVGGAGAGAGAGAGRVGRGGGGNSVRNHGSPPGGSNRRSNPAHASGGGIVGGLAENSPGVTSAAPATSSKRASPATRSPHSGHSHVPTHSRSHRRHHDRDGTVEGGNEEEGGGSPSTNSLEGRKPKREASDETIEDLFDFVKKSAHFSQEVGHTVEFVATDHGASSDSDEFTNQRIMSRVSRLPKGILKPSSQPTTDENQGLRGRSPKPGVANQQHQSLSERVKKIADDGDDENTRVTKGTNVQNNANLPESDGEEGSRSLDTADAVADAQVRYASASARALRLHTQFVSPTGSPERSDGHVISDRDARAHERSAVGVEHVRSSPVQAAKTKTKAKVQETVMPRVSVLTEDRSNIEPEASPKSAVDLPFFS
eukprot:Rmarinus@m.28237